MMVSLWTRRIFSTGFLFVSLVSVAAKDKNAADYPKTAHVVSRGRGSEDFTVGGKLEAAVPTVVKFQIGNVLYITRDMYCLRNVQVGTDVPARVDGQWLHVLVDSKHDCRTSIASVYEK